MARCRLSSLFFGLLLVCQATVGASGAPSPAAAAPASSWFSFQYFAAIVRDAVGGSLYEGAEAAPEHLAADEVARRQADVLEYLAGKSAESMGLADLVEVYHRAGAPSVLHGLVGNGVERSMNLKLGALRRQLHLLVLKDVAAQFKDRTARVGVNDFGSTQNPDVAVDLKTDIDFTLFPGAEADGVAPDEFIRAYEEHFARHCRELGRSLSPHQLDIVPHRFTAMIPDWRAAQSMADFEFKLRRGLSQLRENPEAYFLEGAFMQQVMKRSAEGPAKTFAWVHPDTGQLEMVDATTVRQFFYRPDIRQRYAFGGAVGNWHFWNAHQDDILRAKYLLRNFDEGVALLDTKLRDYETLSDRERTAAVRRHYGDPATSDQARMFKLTLDAAADIRKNKGQGDAAVRAALQPFVEYQRGLLGAGRPQDEDTLLALAHRLYEHHSQLLMVHNIVTTSSGRLQDWLAPPVVQRQALLASADGAVERRITLDPEARERLQKAAFFELRDALALMPDDLVERVRQQNPRMGPEIDILLGVIRKQREMMDAEGEHPDHAIVRRTAAAREALAAHQSLTQRLVARARSLPGELGAAEELVQDHVQEWMVRAVRRRAGSEWADRLSLMRASAKGAGQQAPDEVFRPATGPGRRTTPPADLSQPRWTGRVNTASRMVNVLTAYQKAGEFNLDVAKAVGTEAMSYLPFLGTALDFVNASEHKRGATVGVGVQGISLAATWFVPFWGQTQLLCGAATGVVSLWGESTFRPLLREKLQLAYQGHVDAYEGGLLTTGRPTRVESPRVHLLYPVDPQGQLTVDERRAKFFAYMRPRVSDATRTLAGHGPADDPSSWVQVQSRVILDEITGYVDDWWNATGPFASFDELTVRRAMDEHYWQQETRQQLIEMLVDDYNVGMQAYVMANAEVKEREYGDLWLTLRDLAMQEALLDEEREAYRSSGAFVEAGALAIGAALDEAPQVAPGLEVSVSPRVEIETDQTGKETPRITGFAVHTEVIGSPSDEHPAPFSVRLDARTPRAAAQLPGAATPSQPATIEVAAVPQAGDTSAAVTLTAVLIDGRGQELARKVVDLKFEAGEPQATDDTTTPDDLAGMAAQQSQASDLAVAAEQAAGRAAAECREAATDAAQATTAADEMARQADALEQALVELEARLGRADDLLATVKRHHAEAEQQATRLGEAAHGAEALQQRACDYQEAVARAPSEDDRARLQAPLAADAFDGPLGQGRDAMAAVRRAAADARAAATSLQGFAAEVRTAGAEAGAGAAGAGGAGAAGGVSANASAAARQHAGAARSALAQIDTLGGQAASLVQAARAEAASEPTDAASRGALEAIEQLAARIEEAKQRVRDCPEQAVAGLAAADERVAALRARLEQADARRAALQQALAQREAQLAEAEQLAALVDYLVDFAATYLRRLEVAVIAGKACLNAAGQSREAPAPSSATTTTPPPTADDRCAQIEAGLAAASQAYDLATFRALVAQSSTCSCYASAAAWLERQDRCNALGAELSAAAQAGDLARFRELLGHAVDCDFYAQAAADVDRLERDRRQEAMSNLLGGVIQTLEGIQRQRRGATPPANVPPPPTATPPRQAVPQAAGPQVSEAEKKALEDEINRRYEAWKKRWCTPSWSGCVLYPSGTRAALVEKYLWGAATPQDLQRVRALFQCYDPCVMQDLRTEQAYEQCQRQCRTAVLGEP